MFPWARFRSTKAAVKLHTLLDFQGAIPSFVHISDGKLHDVNVLDLLDRGMISAATIAALEERGLDYILGARERRTKVVREVVLRDAKPFVSILIERTRARRSCS